MENKEYYEFYNKSKNLRMKYPSEIAVGFLINNMSHSGTVLDLGCGAGRHTVLASELGHHGIGLDISRNSFDFGYQNAKSKNVSIDLIQSEMKNTPVKKNTVDALMCLNAINGNSLSGIKEIIDEIYRILKKDGIFLINFYGFKDQTYKLALNHGKKINKEETYVIPGEKFHPNFEKKVPDYTAHFSSEKEIAKLISKFSESKIFDIHLPCVNANINSSPSSHLIYCIGVK